MACGKTGPCVREGELIGTFAPSPSFQGPLRSVHLWLRFPWYHFLSVCWDGFSVSFTPWDAAVCLRLWQHCPLSGDTSWENPRLCLRPATTAALCQGRPSRVRVTTGPTLTHISDSPGRTQSPLDVRNPMAGGWGVDEMAFCGPQPRIPGLSPAKLASAQIRRAVSPGEVRKGCTHSLFSASLLEGGQFCVCSGTSFDVLTGSAFCTCQGHAHPSAPDRWREGGLAARRTGWNHLHFNIPPLI